MVRNSSLIPKLKHFLWLVPTGCLPTHMVLYKRQINQVLMCPICEEEVGPLFLQRGWVKCVWFGGGLSYGIQDQRIVNFHDWFIGPTSYGLGNGL